MEPQTQPQAPISEPRRIGALITKIILVLLFVAGGFALGVYSNSLVESRQETSLVPVQSQSQIEDAGTVPANRGGVTTVTYSGGTTLYFLEKGTMCGDHPRYPCNGALYEVMSGQMKQVASNVVGAELLYYEPGVRALLQSRWGDGGCREAKFYVYDFAAATSTMTFDKSNCDESTYDAYQKAISDYLAQFGL